MARKLSRRTLARYVATSLADGAPQKVIAQQLAAYLLSTGRTKELSVILRDIEVALAEKGHVTGTVHVARSLSTETLKAVEAFAKKATGASHVAIDIAVDEALIGGIKLELPGRELDATIARQLMTLKTRYKKA